MKKEGKKILLVDDDITLGLVVQSILEEEGFEISVLTDGSNVDEVVKTDKPNVIILDYFLPKENGAEVALRLKKANHSKKIPIIMISSSYGIESVAHQVGIDAFLPKPFDIDQLIDLINKHTKTA